MSELDENTGYWPKNPYELLNVEEGVDKKTLKRAYNKLIRRFKPDHFPEQFRRIRQAYEEILEDLEAQFIFRPPPEIEKEISTESDDWQPIKVDDSQDKSRELWDNCKLGDIDEALIGFKELFEKDQDPEIALKVYWVSKFKKVDRLELIAVLARSLKQSFDYRISNLLGREMEFAADWTLSDECFDLLYYLADQHSGKVRPLIDKRWELAFERDNIDIIDADVEKLREPFRLASEEEWGLLILNVHNYISFSSAENSVEYLKKYHLEIDKIPVSAGGQLDDSMDYYEFLREIRRIVRRSRSKIPKKWLRIISGYWTGCDRLYLDELKEELNTWCANTGYALRLFDTLDNQSRAMLFELVRRIVYNYCITLGHYIYMNDEDLMNARCQDYLSERAHASFATNRLSLLYFCLNEDVPPEFLCGYVAEKNLNRYEWVLNVSYDIHQAIYIVHKTMLADYD